MPLYDLIIFILVTISIGSYAAAFSINWPTEMHRIWRKEAHQLLDLSFDEGSFPTNNQRSKCDTCQHSLIWKDLIPLISYLTLKGKCRYCKSRITSQYPIIELIHSVSCIPLFWLFESAALLSLHTLLISALIPVVFIDAKHRLIPDSCCAIILSCGLLINMINNSLEHSILGLLVGYGIIYMLNQFYLIVRKRDGIGLGDAKLTAALGAWLGLSYITPLLLCASLLGILYTITSSKNASKEMPFGPFLIVSAIMMFYVAYDRQPSFYYWSCWWHWFR